MPTRNGGRTPRSIEGILGMLECGIERALNVVEVPRAGIFHKACMPRKE
jgi:hypothetical protein